MEKVVGNKSINVYDPSVHTVVCAPTCTTLLLDMDPYIIIIILLLHSRRFNNTENIQLLAGCHPLFC